MWLAALDNGAAKSGFSTVRVAMGDTLSPAANRDGMKERLAAVKDEKLRVRLEKLAKRYPTATIGELYLMAGRG